MKRSSWERILAGLALTAPLPLVARAETYLTEQQALAVLFPETAMRFDPVELTAAQAKAVEKASGERVTNRQLKRWRGPNGETVFIDRVLGKHEFITYALGIAPDGKVKGVEILDYRETYGGEIRRPQWRQNFTGRSAKDPVKLDKDIPPISGATLSSAHVTNGVRRLLQTYEILKANPPA